MTCPPPHSNILTTARALQGYSDLYSRNLSELTGLWFPPKQPTFTENTLPPHQPPGSKYFDNEYLISASLAALLALCGAGAEAQTIKSKPDTTVAEKSAGKSRAGNAVSPAMRKFIAGGGVKKAKSKSRAARGSSNAGQVSTMGAEMCDLYPDDPDCTSNPWDDDPTHWNSEIFYTDTGATIEIAVTTSSLGQVQVDGISTGFGWCVDGNCAYAESLKDAEWANFVANGITVKDILDYIFGGNDDAKKKGTSCTYPSDKPNSQLIRTTTSLDDEDNRLLAANALIQARLQGYDLRKEYNNKFINVTFVDGGTESFLFAAASGQVTRKEPTDLVKGDGVNQCPP